MPEDTLQNPFVLQCKKCNQVLTDSFTLQTIVYGHFVHTFSALSPPAEPVPGADEFVDCLVSPLVCACGCAVGKMINSANEDWNGCAGMFAFDKNEVAMYTLGQATPQETSIFQLVEDVEKLKSIVAKMYKKVYQ